MLPTADGDKLLNFTNTKLWCVTYYFGVILFGICQPFMLFEDSSAYYLATLAISLPASYWFLGDAKQRGNHVPHVIQPAIVSYWFVAIPLYLLRTRKWRGLLYLAMHVAGTILVTLAGYNFAIWFVWPMIFSSAGG